MRFDRIFTLQDEPVPRQDEPVPQQDKPVPRQYAPVQNKHAPVQSKAVPEPRRRQHGASATPATTATKLTIMGVEYDAYRVHALYLKEGGTEKAARMKTVQRIWLALNNGKKDNQPKRWSRKARTAYEGWLANTDEGHKAKRDYDPLRCACKSDSDADKALA